MKLLRLFFPLLLSLSLSADDAEWFVGLEGGVTGVNLSDGSVKGSYEYGPEYGAKLGLREGNSRIYLGYTAAEKIDPPIERTHNPYLALEGVSDEFKVIARSTARFFFGARLGASIADINNTATTAFMAGLQTGLIFMLPADFEIEVAYRHYFTFKEKETNFNAGAVYGGLNYKFYAF